MTKTQTIQCPGYHHSSQACLRESAVARYGATCPTCQGAGQVEKCTGCGIINCDGCPACAHCDDTQETGCPACESTGVNDDDSPCRPCRGTGKARCWRC